MRNIFYNMFSRMFIGRCGFDDLSRFLMLSVPLPFILSVILRKVGSGYLSMFLLILAMVLFLWSIWRAFSSQLYYRKRENEQFLTSPLYTETRGAYDRFSQRKTHSFYRCPGCKRWLRVPKGAGMIAITCPECGTKFIKKA